MIEGPVVGRPAFHLGGTVPIDLFVNRQKELQEAGEVLLVVPSLNP